MQCLFFDFENRNVRFPIETNHLAGRAIFQREGPLTASRASLVAIVLSLSGARAPAHWRSYVDVCGRPSLEEIVGNFIEKRPNLFSWNTNEERNTEQTRGTPKRATAPSVFIDSAVTIRAIRRKSAQARPTCKSGT
jgi:hypothetical protein